MPQIGCFVTSKRKKRLISNDQNNPAGIYSIFIHTVFKYAGSARLTGKSGGCGT
jgi:hypothetical protein